MNPEKRKGYITRLRAVRDAMVALPDTDTMLYEAAIAALDSTILNLRNSVDVLREAERNVESLMADMERDVERLTKYAKPESTE